MPKKSKKKAVKNTKAKPNPKGYEFKERRKSADRRRGVIDAIYQRLVKRNILPDRRKGDRRADGNKPR